MKNESISQRKKLLERRRSTREDIKKHTVKFIDT